jgi:hypothetical protein
VREIVLDESLDPVDAIERIKVEFAMHDEMLP